MARAPPKSKVRLWVIVSDTSAVDLTSSQMKEIQEHRRNAPCPEGTVMCLVIVIGVSCPESPESIWSHIFRSVFPLLDFIFLLLSPMVAHASKRPISILYGSNTTSSITSRERLRSDSQTIFTSLTARPTATATAKISSAQAHKQPAGEAFVVDSIVRSTGRLNEITILENEQFIGDESVDYGVGIGVGIEYDTNHSVRINDAETQSHQGMPGAAATIGSFGDSGDSSDFLCGVSCNTTVARFLCLVQMAESPYTWLRYFPPRELQWRTTLRTAVWRILLWGQKKNWNRTFYLFVVVRCADKLLSYYSRVDRRHGWRCPVFTLLLTCPQY